MIMRISVSVSKNEKQRRGLEDGGEFKNTGATQIDNKHIDAHFGGKKIVLRMGYASRSLSSFFIEHSRTENGRMVMLVIFTPFSSSSDVLIFQQIDPPNCQLVRESKPQLLKTTLEQENPKKTTRR